MPGEDGPAGEPVGRVNAWVVTELPSLYRLVPQPGFEYISPAVAGLTGHQPEELYLNPALVCAAMEPEDRDAVEASWQSAEPSPLITRWRRPDGSSVWTEQRAVTIRDDSGQIIAVKASCVTSPARSWPIRNVNAWTGSCARPTAWTLSAAWPAGSRTTSTTSSG